MPAPQMSFKAWTYLIALSALWGGSFFLIEIIVEQVRPLVLVFGRVFVAALTLHLVRLALRIPRPDSARQIRAFVILGALNNALPFSLIVAGQTELAGGVAAILNATTPLFTVLLADRLTGDERLSWNRLAGVVIGFVGVAAMLGPAAWAGLGGPVLAQLAILAAAISYALAGIYGRRFKGTPPLITATGQLSASSLLMLPLVVLIEPAAGFTWPGAGVMAAWLALGTACTALAYLLYFRILAMAGATNTVLVTFLVPIFAILLGALFLGERLAITHMLGMAMIGFGLVLIDGRALAPVRPARAS